jgi:hypothetical protein
MQGKRSMTMKKSILAFGLLAAFASSSAFAGDVSNFEDAMRSAYGKYRIALFATNSGKTEAAAKAIGDFSAAWSLLNNGQVPPQYEDDSDFSNTMRAVADLASKADVAVAAGALPDAHETLEHIRDEIGNMHLRSGLFTVSDRMNAYHARMEEVIGNPDMDAKAAYGAAAVLTYLIDDIIAHPPAEAGPDYASLAADVKASIDALKSAAEAGNSDAIKAAIGGLKQPYSKLFLNFG